MWSTIGIICITGGALLLGSTLYDAARRKVRGMMLAGRVLICLVLMVWGDRLGRPDRAAPPVVIAVSVALIIALLLITRARANAQRNTPAH